MHEGNLTESKFPLGEREYIKNDEIDLVDILSVIFKRRWIIIWIVLASFVLSLMYVRFFTTTRYRTSVRIQLPQVYQIGDDNTLVPSEYDYSELIYRIKNYFNNLLNQQDREEGAKITGYGLDIKGSQVIVRVSNSDVGRISEIVNDLYSMYSDVESKVEKKNKAMYELAQRSLQKIIEQKEGIVNQITLATLSDFLKRDPSEFNRTVEILNNLSFDIIKLQRIKNLNNEAELRRGMFELVGKSVNGRENSMIVGNQSDLENASKYIYPEKSRKRRYLPVVVAVFLGFFIGIFLAFVVEFFAREDVKSRLGSALRG